MKALFFHLLSEASSGASKKHRNSLRLAVRCLHSKMGLEYICSVLTTWWKGSQHAVVKGCPQLLRWTSSTISDGRYAARLMEILVASGVKVEGEVGITGHLKWQRSIQTVTSRCLCLGSRPPSVCLFHTSCVQPWLERLCTGENRAVCVLVRYECRL